MLQSFKVNTRSRSQMVSITSEINSIVSKSGVKEGICIVYVPHTTAGITVNEDADPSVASDIIQQLEKLVPWDGRYAHTEGNAAAHIKTSIVGSSLHLIIHNGSLILGTWQGVFLFEFDGPRTRNVFVKVIPND